MRLLIQAVLIKARTITSVISSLWSFTFQILQKTRFTWGLQILEMLLEGNQRSVTRPHVQLHNLNIAVCGWKPSARGLICAAVINTHSAGADRRKDLTHHSSSVSMKTRCWEAQFSCTLSAADDSTVSLRRSSVGLETLAPPVDSFCSLEAGGTQHRSQLIWHMLIFYWVFSIYSIKVVFFRLRKYG